MNSSGSKSIEELLIKEDYVNKKDIEKAKTQAFEFNKKASMPVCLVLAKENRISAFFV